MIGLLAMLLVQTPPIAATSAAQPVTVEYYYRLKWGSGGAFLKLYRKNHEPILKALQKDGYIVAMRTERPFTHLAGGPRWDLRVTITFRDAEAAVGRANAFERAYSTVADRLYRNRAVHDREEDERFAMVEDHWDVIVNPVEDE